MKWKYFVSDISMAADHQYAQNLLNDAGDVGWELVAILPLEDREGERFYKAVFKLPITASSN
jgi:hypothetical protein